MPHKQVPLLCKIYIYNHKEALVSPAEKIMPFVVNIYQFVPRKICCASQRRCHVTTLCDSLWGTTFLYDLITGVLIRVASCQKKREWLWGRVLTLSSTVRDYVYNKAGSLCDPYMVVWR